MNEHIKYAVVGLIFGAVIAAIGFGDYDELYKMFTLTEERMWLTFAFSVVFTMIILFLLRKKIPKQDKILQPGTIPGSMLFGFGWAISGACPAIVFIHLGHGSIAAVSTLFGIFCGIWLQKKLHAKIFRWDTGSCGV
jgi:uncharacterized membrane protein YedE/YeeE